MTVEEIELRKVLKSMLAENGITRETLRAKVDEIINKKLEDIVNQSLHNIVNSNDFYYLITNKIARDYKFEELLKRVVKDYLQDVPLQVSINVPRSANVNVNKES
jgi:hypothetical protein